ncbi:MerR family DNA-binding protein [Streptomyces sp. NBC_01353]|uniref:MerR family DNA-binding protein n=1 Tax=Streptomyces sp. NBC_01353 TaxID=2903835 RepID=UPI002E34B2AC|nr:MerR family DNA-binding protein [Streptomyces sp. NBC_01353]
MGPSHSSRLAEIRSVLALRDSGEAPCDHVTDLVRRHLEETDRRISELRKVRIALGDLARRAADTDPATCAENDICTIFSAQGPATRRGRTEGDAKGPHPRAQPAAGPNQPDSRPSSSF